MQAKDSTEEEQGLNPAQIVTDRTCKIYLQFVIGFLAVISFYRCKMFLLLIYTLPRPLKNCGFLLWATYWLPNGLSSGWFSGLGEYQPIASPIVI